MGVSSVRLTDDEREFLEKLVKEGKYQSLSEALKAGIYEMMQNEQIEGTPWKTCDEIRTYFAKKRKMLRGLEEGHDEES